MTKMKKFHPFCAGNTLDSHKKFIRKLTKRGAKEVESGKSDVTIVFCPIVSRYETDIGAALSSASESEFENIILVAMHHTFDKDYTVPSHRGISDPKVILFVDCLFFESMGLLKCPCNKKAIKAVRKKMGLKKKPFGALP